MVTKSSCAVCKQVLSLSIYRKGKTYPFAHSLADSSSKSVRAESDASWISTVRSSAVVRFPSAKQAPAHAIIDGAIGSIVFPAAVNALALSRSGGHSTCLFFLFPTATLVSRDSMLDAYGIASSILNETFRLVLVDFPVLRIHDTKQ